MSVYKFIEDEKKFFCVTDKLNVMPFRFCRLALSGDKTAAVLRRWRGAARFFRDGSGRRGGISDVAGVFPVGGYRRPLWYDIMTI